MPSADQPVLVPRANLAPAARSLSVNDSLGLMTANGNASPPIKHREKRGKLSTRHGRGVRAVVWGGCAVLAGLRIQVTPSRHGLAGDSISCGG